MATRKTKVPAKDVGAFISHIQEMATYKVGDTVYHRRPPGGGGVFEGKVTSILIKLGDHLGKPVMDIRYAVDLSGVFGLVTLRCHEMERSPEDAFR